MKGFLAVGINHFLRPGNDLSGCVADEKSMVAVAHSLGITDLVYLDDAMATKRNAWDALRSLVDLAKVGKLSYLGFSWSGHGTHYARPSEPDGLGEALVCYDIAEKNGEWDRKTIITDQELKDLLNQVPPTCVVEVWLDTCYSGGMDRALTDRIFYHKDKSITKADRFLHAPDNPAGNLRVANVTMSQGLNSNIIMWCASSEAQESEDAYIAGGPHGAFTWYWTQAFKANPKASRVELLLKTRAGLKKGGYDQFPRLKCYNAKAQGKVGT